MILYFKWLHRINNTTYLAGYNVTSTRALAISFQQNLNTNLQTISLYVNYQSDYVSESHIKHAVCVRNESKGWTCPMSAVKSVTKMVLSRHCRMKMAIKQADTYLLIVHFGIRSSRNGKNPHSRGCLLTHYQTNYCCQ
jgi:hypothetical protein